jgi:hypothetical protein
VEKDVIWMLIKHVGIIVVTTIYTRSKMGFANLENAKRGSQM